MTMSHPTLPPLHPRPPSFIATSSTPQLPTIPSALQAPSPQTSRYRQVFHPTAQSACSHERSAPLLPAKSLPNTAAYRTGQYREALHHQVVQRQLKDGLRKRVREDEEAKWEHVFWQESLNAQRQARLDLQDKLSKERGVAVAKEDRERVLKAWSS